MSTKVKYKGQYIVNESGSCHKLLQTQGKYLEDNIEIEATGGGEEPVLEHLVAKRDGMFTPASPSIGFDQVKVDGPAFVMIGRHTNPITLKWERPKEWDDIESVEVDEDESVAYYLIDCHCHEWSWFRFRVYGSGLKGSWGHIVNGEYVPSVTESTISSGAYYGKEDLYNLDDDYIVVRLTGTTLTYITHYARSTAPALAAANMPILMRYANLPKASAMSTCANYTIESDYIMNWFRDSSSKSISFSSAWATNINLQRLYLPNNNIANQTVTSCASCFSSCVVLIDVDDPFDVSGWVQATTTSCTSMFSGCYNLRTAIDVSDWDLTKVTTMASCFTNCSNVPGIIGTETWTEALVCTTCASLFSGCYKLRNKIDVRGAKFGQSGKLTTCASMFVNCWSITEIDISGMDLSNCTTVTGMFSYCRSIENIDFSGVVGTSNACTVFTSMFSYCYSLKEVEMDGWDFSAGSVLTMFYYCYNIQRIDFPNCTPSAITMADTSSNNIFGYCYNLEYLDERNLFANYDQFSSTYAHSAMHNTMYFGREWYPSPGFCKATSISGCTQWSHDTLIRVLNALDTVNNLKLTLGTVNLAKLTDDEKAIATGKGWVLA